MLSQKEVGVKRVETLVSTLLPRRGARHVPAVRRRRISSLNLSEKTSRPLGANTLAQFAHPAQSVLKKRLPPRQDVALRASCTSERRWFLKIKRKTTHFREWFSWWKLQGSNL